MPLSMSVRPVASQTRAPPLEDLDPAHPLPHRPVWRPLVRLGAAAILPGHANHARRPSPEGYLGNVDADERGSLVHDPVSLDAGLLALVTVRVARTRPAGRHVLARPSWTRGTAGSRRPTRSRYQIGSRQHTKWDNANRAGGSTGDPWP